MKTSFYGRPSTSHTPDRRMLKMTQTVKPATPSRVRPLQPLQEALILWKANTLNLKERQHQPKREPLAYLQLLPPLTTERISPSSPHTHWRNPSQTEP